MLTLSFTAMTAIASTSLSKPGQGWRRGAGWELPPGIGEPPRIEVSDSSENLLPPGCDYAKTTIDATKKYDLCTVGAGLSGTVFAERTANVLGGTVLVLDNRPHIGGNCYDFVDQKTGIIRNQYGSHLFHTNIERVWKYITSNPNAPPWESWYHMKYGVVNGTYVPIPVNIITVNRLFGTSIQTEAEMRDWLKSVQIPCPKGGCRNSEEMAKSRVGEKLFKAVFEGYTIKQWAKHPRDLDASVTARIPVRDNFDLRYFADKWQALPRDGYTAWFEAMLKHPKIDVALSVDFFEHKEHLERACGKIVYTGPIDRYFEAEGMEKLEYRSIKFTEFRHYHTPGYILPTPVVNYPGMETNYTRAVEYKHYLHRPSPHSIVVKETSAADGEPYYPVPTDRNHELYSKYKKLAEEIEATGKVLFVGRLANYKYFNMDQAINNALELFDTHMRGMTATSIAAPVKSSGDPQTNSAEIRLRAPPVPLLTGASVSATACALSHAAKWIDLFDEKHFAAYKGSIDTAIAEYREQRRTHTQLSIVDNCTNAVPLYPGEFGMELRVFLPWAYYHSRRCIIRTQGVIGTKYMYPFSDEHTIINSNNTASTRKYCKLPASSPFSQVHPGKGDYKAPAKFQNRRTVHRSSIPRSGPNFHWLPPPFKFFFNRPDVRCALSTKPLLVILNKYTTEWDHPPANFFGVELLRKMLKHLTSKYTILYKRHTPKDLRDQQHSFETGDSNDLAEKGMIRSEFPEVVFYEDLAAIAHVTDADDHNLLTLGLMASADRHVAVQGGTAVLASYFGGDTAILIKEGRELDYGDYGYFNRFSNASVAWKTSDENFMAKLVEMM